MHVYSLGTLFCLSASLIACGSQDAPKPPPAQTHSSEAVATPSEVDAPSPPKPAVAPTSPASTDGSITCTHQPFASTIPLAEASGATVLENGTLIVVGDSGTDGAFLHLDAKTGAVQHKGKLPLDSKSSDDLEGLAHMDGKLYGITSSGWMREWAPKQSGYKLIAQSYALAKYDSKMLVCRDPRDSNCAQNYEGLCLQATHPKPGQCAGFAASKTKGLLICLTYQQARPGRGTLRLDPSRTISVASAHALTGCHFDENDRLWFGTNFFAANSIGFVEGWQTPKTATITELGPVGFGFDEALAVGPGGAVYRFSDTSASPSLLGKYICR